MKKMFVSKFLVLVVITFSFFHAQEEKEYKKDQRLVITGIIPGGSAEVVGLEPDDIVVSYNGVAVHSLEKLGMLKTGVQIDSVEIVVKRGGELMSFIIPKGMIGVYVKEVLPDIEFAKDAVVIDGVGSLGWDTGESNSFIAALTRIAEYFNIDKDYTYLMGTSGAAFRIHFHEDWCPSSPDPTVGFDCGIIAARSIGLVLEPMFLDEGGENRLKMQQRIMQSIDNEMPVIAIDLIEVPEWGLIVGYQKDGKELIVRDYFDRREGYGIAEKFPWIIMTVSKDQGKIDDNNNFKNSLKIAHGLYGTEKFEKYYSGITAIEYWISRLEEDDFGSFEEERFDDVMLANAWIFERFADDRLSAAKYLKSFVTRFPQAEDEINKLASFYEEENELMPEAETIVPYPSQIEKREDWTDEMRSREIEILKKLLEIEQEAYSIIKEINKRIED